ncbi:MAG: GNAT family N-acetyltransferase, partial [Bacillota bacterium]
VHPSCRGKGIGKALWSAIQPLVEAPEVTLAVTFYRGDRGHTREFFYPRGFQRWFGTHLMYYRGGKLPEPSLEARPYDDALFEEYIRMINEGFSPMREQNDIKPYRVFADDAPQDQELRKKTIEHHRENAWFFYDGEQLVGWAELDGAEIDTVAVASEHQRRGYGRQIMHYCTNHLLDKGHHPVQLHVVETNEHVKRFYESIGFELIETYEYARKMK